MTVSSNGRQTSTRQRRARTGVETSTKLENMKGKNVSTDNQDNATDKVVKADSTKEEVTGTLAVSGKRPITTSDLDIAHTMMVSGERPVSSSDLQIVDTVNIMGIRPIGANKIQFNETMNLSGIRPIAKSDLVVSEVYSVMGNRPVASNQVDDSFSLMGFLD